VTTDPASRRGRGTRSFHLAATRRIALTAGIACAAVGFPALTTGALLPATPSKRSNPDSMSVSLSSRRAGARPVAITVRLRTELQCGRLTGSVAVRLPAEARLPRKIRASAVRIDGRPSSRVAIAGHTLSIGAPTVSGVICHVIAPGTTTIVLTRSANVGNPPAAGTYPVVLRHRGGTARASVRITDPA
jgi:hypothetical protein